MIFKYFEAGVLAAHCFIVGDEKTKEGIVVDPGGNLKGILAHIEEYGLKIKYILITHGHGDHCFAAVKLKEATGAEILMNHRDEYLTLGETKKLIPILMKMDEFKADRNISEGDIIKVGDISIKVVEVPGHSPGSIAFVFDDRVISGDVVFRGTIGRSDMEFASQDQLIASIKEKIMKLPDETVIYPGHGPTTTVGKEKVNNPYLI